MRPRKIWQTWVVWVIGPRADEEAYHLAVARVDTYNGDPRKKTLMRQLLTTAWG